MSRESRIQYNPALSVKENAKKNGVSEAAIRDFIKTHSIDRRYDRKQNIIEDCRKYLKKHPKATWDEIQKKTGHSLSTIRKYREYILTEKELTDFDAEKAKKRQLRQVNNYYATHPSVTQDILNIETFNHEVLEPFCGGGTMAEVIKHNGYEVEAYDLYDRGYGKVGDFFNVEFSEGQYDIITNPPYDGNLIAIIKRCLTLCKDKVAILLPIQYLSGKERHTELYGKFPPSRVYIYCERINIAKNGEFEKYSDPGSNMTIYAWYIWEKGYKGSTELKWIHNNKQEKEEEVIEKPKIEEVTILDGIPFKPYEEFRIPVNECIQFHSKALPENQILSNHYDCIITFRGVEFYALEQMYMSLNYSDSPGIVKKIMACNSGLKAKSLCSKQYPDKKDWDFEGKRYRIIALCHLYKYLSVKEYRDRLRETYPQTLVECPNGKDYHFGMVQNLETNVFEGNNCSGRTTMIVRDRMKALEDEAVMQRQEELGRELTPGERDEVFEGLYARIRVQFDNDSQVLKDSKPLFTIIEKEGIPKVKTRRPKPFVPPSIDRETKCLVMDFDDTLFDTSADDEYRKGKEKDMDKAMAMIPDYKLYDGWQEVIDWTKKNGVKIGILSAASGKLIEKALKYFQIPYSAIIGYQPYIEKPNTILGNMLQERLNIRHEQIIYVGNSKSDETQARASQFRFIGVTWSSRDADYFTEQGVQTISNPKELIAIMEGD